MSAFVRKRKILTLEERVAALQKVDCGMSCHWIANELDVGKIQIQEIVRDRQKILKRWEGGERSDRKYTKVRKIGYKELDKVVWEWFTRARAKNIPVSGKLIQERTLMYTAELGHSSFTASNSWLEKWQKRHNVRMTVVLGEAANVDLSVVSDWSGCLKSVCQGYALTVIFNADETGLYRALPTRALSEAKGGKKSKYRIAVLLACSAIEEGADSICDWT